MTKHERRLLVQAVGSVCAVFAVCVCELNVVYQWDKLDLTVRDNDTEHPYVPENNLVYRMKIWNGTMYMAIPRFKQGVPVTLCKSHEGAVRPFPTFGMQKVGNCFGVQNAKDIEIDHLGRLWTLDVGVVYDLQQQQADHTCDPKLFVVDIRTGMVVRSAVLPSYMFSARSVFSGISLDLKTLTAVVADVGPDPAFIVYNMQTGIFRKFQCNALAAVSADVRRSRPSAYNEALLTVSPIDNILYFTTIQSDSLYAIPLSVFDAPTIVDVTHYVNNQGLKPDTSTAMVMDTAGNLYLGMTRKVIAWSTLKHSFDVNELYIQEVRLEWISSFAFDSNGYLWIISSPFEDFRRPANAKISNVKIFKRYCGTTSFALLDNANSDQNASPAVRNSADAKTPVNPYYILLLLLSNVFMITYKPA